ncbi:hypothetical protein FKZ61_007495 [Litorilinea aerophila]|uniref:Uncharacterized protein n=1 Tax=Litorilinea aerophila TaxID=1204385 RepID=A0A540VHU1_9CHLR|nr:hypothetical protein [Litorilinea aerophila]MCC9075952.1 hypothetical protein [Litorilinea aerophila]
MEWLTPLEEALLHREVAVQTLQGLLRERGSKERLARQLGVSPQYLSYLLDPWNHRTPSPALARRLVAALPLEPEQRATLWEHLMLCQVNRLEARRAAFLEGRRSVLLNAEEHLHQLLQASAEAQFGPNAVSRVKYRLVYEGGRYLAQVVGPREDLRVFIEASLVAHNAANVLNYPVSALWMARQVNYVPEEIWLQALRDREEAIHYQVYGLLATATAYHNLGLYGEEYACCDQAEALLAEAGTTRLQENWLPHLYRNKLNALMYTPRFSIGEAENIAHRAQEVIERASGHTLESPFGQLLLFLIQVSLGRAYIRNANRRRLNKAEVVLRGCYDALAYMPLVGPLHRTLLLRAMAEMYGKMGSQEYRRHFLRSAYQEASAAGLTHQRARILAKLSQEERAQVELAE